MTIVEYAEWLDKRGYLQIPELRDLPEGAVIKIPHLEEIKDA